MSIHKTVMSPTGVSCAFHRAVIFAIYDGSPTARVTATVNSWADEDAFKKGLFLAGSLMVDIPHPAGTSGNLLSEIEAYLVGANIAGNPFFGGTLVLDTSVGSLSAERLAAWARIKEARSEAEYGGMTWDGSGFDTDGVSQSRIMGAIIAAGMTGASFSIDWTLADNTVRAMSATDMNALGLALSAHVAAQHEKARLLRVQIEAAETVEQVRAVQWI